MFYIIKSLFTAPLKLFIFKNKQKSNIRNFLINLRNKALKNGNNKNINYFTTATKTRL